MATHRFDTTRPRIIQIKKWWDKRGSFHQLYNDDYIDGTQFVQDNTSMSYKHVLRGLHYHTAHPQGKLITVLQGAIQDVIVNLDPTADDYGQPHTYMMTHWGSTQLWVPPGWAHGFLTLDDRTIVTYKTTQIYYPDDQHQINPFDPDLAISWAAPREQIVLSDQDSAAPPFKTHSK